MNTPAGSLKNLALSWSEFALLSQARKNHVLGAICYGATAPVNPTERLPDTPWIRVVMPVLGDMHATTPSGQADTLPAAVDSICDVWVSATPLEEGRYADIHYRHDGNILFGVITLAEGEAPPEAATSPLQHCTERAYRQLFELLDTLGYPHVYRLWNYMADINGHSHGLERYRQFNLGRQDAFKACRRDVAGNVPAACALGAAEGLLTIAFLAGKTLSKSIENPRQVSAYDYPESYGPRSPVFSRASLAQIGANEVLLISGTASIVGHDTVHPGDVLEQTRETLRNIEAVVHAANLQANKPDFSLSDLCCRVYLRHRADLATVQAIMQARLGAGCNAVFLLADVCRQDLLVEIEASAWLPA